MEFVIGFVIGAIAAWIVRAYLDGKFNDGVQLKDFGK